MNKYELIITEENLNNVLKTLIVMGVKYSFEKAEQAGTYKVSCELTEDQVQKLAEIGNKKTAQAKQNNKATAKNIAKAFGFCAVKGAEYTAKAGLRVSGIALAGAVICGSAALNIVAEEGSKTVRLIKESKEATKAKKNIVGAFRSFKSMF